jgi:hypothetical protein
VSATSAKYLTGQSVKLKSGETVTIVGIDPVGQTYKVMGADNKYSSIKPAEIEKIAKSKYADYQQSGPNPENPEELAIKTKDVTVDQNA